MKRKILLFIGCLSFVCSATELQAQSRKKKEQQRIEQEKKAQQQKEQATKDSIAKITPYERLLKDPQKVVKGLMNLYYIKGKLYLEVPLRLLDRDMLLASTISEISDNYDGVVGSKPAPLRVQFSRVDSSLLLRKIETETITPASDRNIQQALDKNSIGAIMKIFSIQAYNKDRSAAVIDVTDYFLNDTKELSPFGVFSIYGAYGYKSSQSFKRDRSFIGEIKAFEDNVLIKSHLSYENSLSDAKRTLVKDKPFTVVMTRTFLLLNDRPVTPRQADERIGIFTTGKYRLSNSANKTETVYFANRWKLEPKDSASYLRGELTEPVKPIIFYVDPDFPESWKPAIKAAVNEWQLAFEKIGFRNAIMALDYPKNDSAFDPDNLKYNCIRYAPVPVANAMGPSWVDPRSGEIINASVYVFHDVVKLLNNWIFVQTAPANKAVRQVQLPENWKQDGIKYVLRHEIGHCLGFMHNMGASGSIPVDSLRSPSFTKQYGTTYSIMDYARFNYIAQPGDLERGVQLTPPTFGLYDYYMVQWNYAWFGPNVTAEEEKKKLAALISAKASDPRYRYGAQGYDRIDPHSQTEDLGDDGVKAAQYGIRNLKYILQNLNSWVGDQDKDYTYRKEIWNNVLSQYVRYINHVYAIPGGFYLHEKHVGDPVPFYIPVPVTDQKRAVQFLLGELQDLNWLEDKKILENMTLTGTPATSLRTELTGALLELPMKVNLNALKSSEAKPYTSKEVMKELYAAVWKKTIRQQVPGKAEREVQKAFINAVLSNSKLAPAAKPQVIATAETRFKGVQLQELAAQQQHTGCMHNDAVTDLQNNNVTGFYGYSMAHFNIAPPLESLYYGQLLDVKQLLTRAVTTTTDTETVMHYKLLLHQIDKAIK